MAQVRFAIALVSLVALCAVAWALERPRAGVSAAETVHLAPGGTISLATPAFIEKGKRYSFSWPGGGPPQTFMVKDMRPDGWILVEVAEENVDPGYVPYGTLPTRWLNASTATSIQEMRPLLYPR